MRLILLFIFSFSSFAQDNLFDQYLSRIEENIINKKNSVSYLEKTERTFFKEVSALADELKFTDEDINFISAKDNLNKTLSKWESHTKNFNLKKNLKEIINSPQIAINNPKLFQSLKDNRKYAHLMRESFYVFDKSHIAPKKLESFVKPFGKLNDAIITKDKELIKKYASKVLDNYKSLNTKALTNKFNSINKSEFLVYFKSIKNDVNTIFSKDITTPHDFHTLRKQYKRFLTVYNNLDVYIPHPKMKLLDNYISKLGELNDIYTDMRFRYGLDLHEYEISFPKKFKFEILDTIQYLEDDMSSIQLGRSCSSFFKSM